MGVRVVFFTALATLPLAAAPALAEGEGNGPAGNDGAFAGWTVAAPTGGGSATNANADGYVSRPCFSETLSGTTPTGGVSEVGFNAWPAQALGGAGAGTTHARASGARGAPRG